jgi:hypothetical protein
MIFQASDKLSIVQKLEVETGFVYRVKAETPTRFWVNNPSGTEVKRAPAETVPSA